MHRHLELRFDGIQPLKYFVDVICRRTDMRKVIVGLQIY